MTKTNDKLDVVLNMNDKDFASNLVEAIGAKAGDDIKFIIPQFERVDGISVAKPLCDFTELHKLSEQTLETIGCSKWGEPDENGEVLWLFPYQWYEHIPNGLMVTDINGETEPFQSGVTDNDMRFGVLAYGFKKKAREAKS